MTVTLTFWRYSFKGGLITLQCASVSPTFKVEALQDCRGHHKRAFTRPLLVCVNNTHLFYDAAVGDDPTAVTPGVVAPQFFDLFLSKNKIL